jgi:hypothetical protein
MNRFQRTASNYAYYGYLTRYTPENMRVNQSERNHTLGRRGAFDTLVWKMAADHINYEEDFNIRYKVPAVLVNASMRISMFWFWVPAFFISFYLGDMVKLFTPWPMYYPGRPGTAAESPTRYETMYFHDRKAMF